MSPGLVICYVIVLSGGKVECALFGSNVDLLLKIMGKSANGMPVVVLQFVKVKIFRGMVVIVCLLLMTANRLYWFW